MLGLVDVRSELDPHPAGIDIRQRGVQTEPAVVTDDVPLPAAPRDGPALIQQESVSRVGIFCRAESRHGIEAERKAAEHSPVGDHHQYPPVAPASGPEHSDIGGEANPAVAGPRSELQIDDATVGLVRWIYREGGSRGAPTRRAGPDTP